MSNKLIDVGIAIVILAIIVGSIAMPIFSAVSTAGWNSTIATIWPYLIVIAFVGILLIIINHARKTSDFVG